MTTEKTSSPRRSGADWFGLVAFAVLVICSAVLVARLISTKFLPTGQLLLAVGARISNRLAASSTVWVDSDSR